MIKLARYQEESKETGIVKNGSRNRHRSSSPCYCLLRLPLLLLTASIAAADWGGRRTGSGRLAADGRGVAMVKTEAATSQNRKGGRGEKNDAREKEDG